MLSKPKHRNPFVLHARSRAAGQMTHRNKKRQGNKQDQELDNEIIDYQDNIVVDNKIENLSNKIEILQNNINLLDFKAKDIATKVLHIKISSDYQTNDIQRIKILNQEIVNILSMTDNNIDQISILLQTL